MLVINKSLDTIPMVLLPLHSSYPSKDSLGSASLFDTRLASCVDYTRYVLTVIPSEVRIKETLVANVV